MLTVRTASRPVLLDADAARLAQVFSNLLHNACKYTEPGGHIDLAVELDGREVAVRVRDDGTGIPPTMLEQVFELFVQIERRLERSSGGLGVGLALVKRVVEMHAGRVRAHSDGPDRGSEFTVWLPLAAIDVASAASQWSPATALARPLRVLLADDNRDQTDSLALLLQLDGHDVHVANDGLQAFERATEVRPDVAVLDLGMPCLDGIALCRRLREQPWGASITLVALTGWGAEGDLRRTREAGFDHHFAKPVDPARLTALLGEIGAGHGLRTARVRVAEDAHSGSRAVMTDPRPDLRAAPRANPDHGNSERPRPGE